MKAIEILKHESDFKAKLTDNNGRRMFLSPFSLDIPGTSEKIDFIRCMPEIPDESYFFKDTPAKEKIVLHHTAGYLKSDITTLTKPNYHVSVPFVLGRDGSIYNLFASKYWSYHLGGNSVGGNESMSKASIGIEISNIGPLRLNGDNLYDYYGNLYCHLTETQYYKVLDVAWRGYSYFATFTDAQYESLIKLLKFLTNRYNIPPVFLPENRRFETLTLQEIRQFKGILSHANFRKDKSDMSPAFDYSRLVGQF
ncbi:MAG TPA: peptidoglycan recognition family protein [Bacteroidia bacterium]|nr:peptidoglycan recognition family protein [Bacteroidia bacterium]HRS58717.1 peptidoglycan recognition family protein [Bacteroidia bacterium]